MRMKFQHYLKALCYNVDMSEANNSKSPDQLQKPIPRPVIYPKTSAYRSKRFIGGILITVVASALIFIFFNNLAGIAFCLAGFLVVSIFSEVDIFEAFALSNGYQYQKDGQLSEQTGIMFYISNANMYQNVVYGTYQQWPFYLFNFNYTVGESAQNSHTYFRTVMTINFFTRLPAFFLRKHNVLQMLKEEGEALQSFGYTEKIELEGDFRDHFQVYIEPDTQDDVLAILTPDVMDMLVRLDKYEIEMTEAGDFYIYRHGYIKNQHELADIYVIVEAITQKLGFDIAIKQELPSAD